MKGKRQCLFIQLYFKKDTELFISSAAKVDLDHLLLDGGWKRGEFEWLKFVCFQC